MITRAARARISLWLVLLALAAAPARADRVVTAPGNDTPEAPVALALSAALSGDFDRYLGAIHSEHRGTPQERDQRQQYEWSRFLEQFRWYLKSEDPLTFVVVSVRVDAPDRRRVFLRDQIHADRMPVPVRVRRDGDVWRIVVNSL